MDSGDLIDIDLEDRVRVSRGGHDQTAIVSLEHGMIVGDWYVLFCRDSDAIRDNPDSNFVVGHNPTGLKLVWGVTFWEARRVALALVDADPQFSLELGDVDLDPDIILVAEAIVASALMDHYVFPLARHLVVDGRADVDDLEGRAVG